MEWAIGSIGGFCVGSSFVIEHHRLSGLGYCFSASLPPLLTSAATSALDIMENQPKLFETLQKNCIQFHEGLKEIEHLKCISAENSPVKHLCLKNYSDYDIEHNLLIQISKKCFENNLSVIVPPYLKNEREHPRPSLKICISASLNLSDIDFALKVIQKASLTVLSNLI